MLVVVDGEWRKFTPSPRNRRR